MDYDLDPEQPFISDFYGSISDSRSISTRISFPLFRNSINTRKQLFVQVYLLISSRITLSEFDSIQVDWIQIAFDSIQVGLTQVVFGWIQVDSIQIGFGSIQIELIQVGSQIDSTRT